MTNEELLIILEQQIRELTLQHWKDVDEIIQLRERIMELTKKCDHLSGVNDDYYMPGHKDEV